MPIRGRWVVWAILMLGSVCLLGGASNASEHKLPDAAVCFGLSAVLLMIFAHQLRERREEKELVTCRPTRRRS